jgi:uncharacterized protein YpbB
VDENVLKMDKGFKRKSKEMDEYIDKMEDTKKEKSQKKFLSFLPRIDATGKHMKEKKEFVPTHLKTGNFVAQKMSIKEIADSRGLSEETIINHLEKLVDDKKYIDLEYLRPPRKRFEKIKMAFKKSENLFLTPAREILGDDFSYQEIRIARLFLTKIKK